MTLHFARAQQAVRVAAILVWIAAATVPVIPWWVMREWLARPECGYPSACYDTVATFGVELMSQMAPAAVILWIACVWRIGVHLRALAKGE